MKYIVKNCPIYQIRCHECYKYCHRCIDCLIKRVIEEVEWEIKTIPNENNRGDLAERILSMFEIESEEE